MEHGTFHGRLILDHVDSKTRAFSEQAELVIDRCGVNRVLGEEGRLASSLGAYVLYDDVVSQSESKKREKHTYVDTFNNGLFFIHDGSVDVAPEDTGYGSLVLALSRFAEVDHAPANTCVCVSGGLDW
jgi:hypothetical protein